MRTIQAQKAQLKELEARMTQLQSVLDEHHRKLDLLTGDLREIQNHADRIMADQQAIQAQLDASKLRIARAHDLLGALSLEQVRWES